MDVSPQRLQQALVGRYRIESEIGRGGMASVFLAEDLKHHRRVAIKVLHPETAAAIGPDRFLREIEFVSALIHPNILPLHDSGDADGLLYYVMPYIAGESLHDYLARTRPLPVEEALRIAREVAEALDYAHRQGVVHRDIKPGNVLLADGHALVADFGIAVAVGAVRPPHLTRTGQMVGTPAYLSPEQATGSQEIDGRSDIYSLGCLLYEMLAGHAPFMSPSEEGLILQHLAGEAPPLTATRPSVPPGVASAVQRAMAKTPVLRFATASEFAAALAAGSAPRRSRMLPPALLVGGALAVVALGILMVSRRSTRSPVPQDANAVAVLPFRVVGPDIDYLAEGMVDLLSAKLTGEGGPRAVDPRALVSAWRRAVGSGREDLPQREALELCRRLGAGQMVEGSLVRSAPRLMISASWVTVPEGRRVADAAVEGSPDSLASLVDRLTTMLLARGAGRSDREVAALTSASLPALRHYLTGRAAYRRGQYRAAVDHFDRALQLDTTFTLAALGMVEVGSWVSTGTASAGAVAIAWSQRHRLAPRERAYLAARLGPRYPLTSSFAERVVAWESVIEAAPDRPESWYELGDTYFHGGPAAGIADAHELARAAFQRAFALDSTFVAPVDHLIELAAFGRDTAAVRALTELYLRLDPRLDPGEDRTDYIRWRAATALADRAAMARLSARMPDVGTESLWRIVGRAQEDGLGIEDAVRADSILRGRAASDAERLAAHRRSWGLALNRGRPREALALMETVRARHRPANDLLREIVLAALFWDGDSGAAAGAARALEPALDRPPSVDDPAGGAWWDDLGVVLLWKFRRGDVATAEGALARLRRAHALREAGPGATPSLTWLSLLEAESASAAGRPEAPRLIRHADSLLATGHEWRWTPQGNLVAAALLEAQGDLPGALAATRRRIINFNAPVFSTALREEGRLAARLGDRAAAIRAYRHYLALRSSPEPALAPAVERVRSELAGLGQPPDR